MGSFGCAAGTSTVAASAYRKAAVYAAIYRLEAPDPRLALLRAQSDDPILAGKVTTDEVLEHRFTESDVENFRRVLTVATRVRPEIKPLAGIAERLLENAEGQSLHAIIFGRKNGKR